MKCKEGCPDYRPGCYATCRRANAGEDKAYWNYRGEQEYRVKRAGHKPEAPGWKRNNDQPTFSGRLVC